MVNRDKLRGVFPSDQIVFAIRDVFAIRISAEEAASILTVGQLYDHILANFSYGQQEGCLRSVAFYKLRRALITCGVPREAIKLDAWLTQLMPTGTRKYQWSQLRAGLNLPLPELQFPNSVQFGIGVFAIVAVILITSAFVFCKLLPWSLISGVAGVAIIVALKTLDNTRISNRLAVEVPSDYETVRRATEQLVTWNYAELARRSDRWSNEELFISVRNLVAYICSARPEEVTAETKFTDLPDFE
jgi:hypothetical protein